MASERGYEQQIGPGGAAAAPVQAGADAFGAGVGEGIAQLGGELHRAEIQHYEIERRQTADREAANGASQQAQVRLANDTAIDDLRTNAAPGGAGHVAAVQKMLDGQREKLLEGVTEDRVRQQLGAQFDGYAASTLSREHEWQTGTSSAKLVTDTGKAIATAANRTRTSANGTVLGQELVAMHHQIDALRGGGVPDATLDKLSTEAEQSIHIGYLNGLLDQGKPTEVKTLIDSGSLNDKLTPEQLDQARNGAEIEERHVKGLQQQQLGLIKAQVNDTGQLIRGRLAAGEVVPDSELAAQAAAYRQIGDQSGAYDLEVEREKAGINRSTQPWQPADYKQRIDTLNAKGDKRSPREDRELKQLQTIAPDRTRGFVEDPGNWAALNGDPRPVFDPADPASVQKLSAWSTRVQATTGVTPPPFSKEQAGALHAIASTGTAQERAALAMSIIHLGPMAGKARDQIGGDPSFRAAMRMGGTPQSASLIAMALEGAGNNDKALLTPAKDDAGQPLAPTPEALFAREIGGATALTSDGYRQELMLNARNLYLYHAKRSGTKSFDSTAMQGAIREALGSKLGWWAGDRVWLPTGMNAASFERRMGQATRENWQAAAPGGKLPWTSGGEMTPAELRTYVPTRAPNGNYRLRQGDSYAVTKDGGFFEFDPAKLWDGPRLSATPGPQYNQEELLRSRAIR